MMKILQIVPSISLVYGGPSQMILGLSKALANLGVQLTLITTDSNGDTGQLPLDVSLEEPLKQDGYEIIYFRCSPFRRYKFSMGLLRWLASNAKDYDIAHIHALFSPVSTAAATIARNKNLPYILRPLGTLDPADLQKKKQLKKIYSFLWEKPNIAGAAGIHFTTEEESKISERFGVKTKDLVIPLGVDLPQNLPEKGKARWEFGINENIPLILFMSRIDPKKGLDLLIPALKILQEEKLNFHFVLAGSNPQDPEYEGKIQEQLRNSSLASQVTIAGFVSGDLKLALLQDADLFVLPSYYENFGIAVAEAMAMGIPVVISQGVYIWDEVTSYEAGWVTKCELEDLVAGLRLAISNPTECQHRGLNAKKLVGEKYSWEAIAQQTLSAYKSLLNKN